MPSPTYANNIINSTSFLPAPNTIAKQWFLLVWVCIVCTKCFYLIGNPCNFLSNKKSLTVNFHSQGRIYVSWCHPLFIVLFCNDSIATQPQSDTESLRYLSSVTWGHGIRYLHTYYLLSLCISQIHSLYTYLPESHHHRLSVKQCHKGTPFVHWFSFMSFIFCYSSTLL